MRRPGWTDPEQAGDIAQHRRLAIRYQTAQQMPNATGAVMRLGLGTQRLGLGHHPVAEASEHAGDSDRTVLSECRQCLLGLHRGQVTKVERGLAPVHPGEQGEHMATAAKHRHHHLARPLPAAMTQRSALRQDGSIHLLKAMCSTTGVPAKATEAVALAKGMGMHGAIPRKQRNTVGTVQQSDPVVHGDAHPQGLLGVVEQRKQSADT